MPSGSSTLDSIVAFGTAFAGGAAAIAAYVSYRGISLSHRPYVYGERAGSTHHLMDFTLHNDGAGTAFDVRARIEASDGFCSEVIGPVRAMRTAEALPSYTVEFPIERREGGWSIVTRCSDIGGAVREVRSQREPVSRVERRALRSGRWPFWRARADW